jgi:DNA-binding MarR family transcriptional regulator
MDRDTHEKDMVKQAKRIERRFANLITLSPKQKQVYRIIAHNPGITSREICQMLGVQRQTLFDKITKLIDSGLVIAKTLDNHRTKAYKVDKRKRVLL